MASRNSNILKGGLVAVGLLIAVAILQFSMEPDLGPKYDLTRSDRNTIEALAWVVTVFNRGMVLTSENYNGKLQRIERFFTPEGYKDYVILLQGMNAISYLKNSDVNVVPFVIGQPELIARGAVDGAFVWRVKFNLNYVIQYSGNSTRYPLVLQADLMRVADEQAFEGIRMKNLTIVSQK